MRKRRVKVSVFLSVVLLSLLARPAGATFATTERTEASLISEASAVRPGQNFWAVLHIHLQPGWHTYWKNPGDSGTPPALAWTLPNGFHAGPTLYLAPERQRIGPLVDYGYSDDAYYLTAITPPAILRPGATAVLALKAEWLVCKDICVPEKADLSLALPATDAVEEPVSADAARVSELAAKLPAPWAAPVVFHHGGGRIRFALAMADAPSVDSAVFFPETDGLVVNAADPEISILPGKIEFSLKAGEAAAFNKARGVVSLTLKDHTRRDYEIMLASGSAVAAAGDTDAAGSESSDVLAAAFFAFLGGIILNFMPCVFPILSLKALAVARKAKANPVAIRAQGIAYAAGVLTSFLVLAGLLVALQHAGGAAGWGYQMQSPVFVALLAALLFVVGLNLSGYYELPIIWGNVGRRHAERDDVIGGFATGVLAVLVATPCTAPFMAPAIGFALAQNTLTVFAVFTALGLGMAAPFLLISLLPRVTALLPKPGAWMGTFRQFLAFPMYLAAAWLLWVLARGWGADALGIALCALVLLTFAVWLTHRGTGGGRRVAWLVAIAALLSAGLLIHRAGMAHGMQNAAEAFSFGRLQALRKDGKAVFVDATADWCITCKVNETVALSSPEVLAELERRRIAYLVADWTREDKTITQYLASFGRSGVPLYVYYPVAGGMPVVLPQILTPGAVLEALRR